MYMYTVFYRYNLSLKGHSKEDTPLERTQSLGSISIVNACDTPSHQMTLL